MGRYVRVTQWRIEARTRHEQGLRCLPHCVPRGAWEPSQASVYPLWNRWLKALP